MTFVRHWIVAGMAALVLAGCHKAASVDSANPETTSEAAGKAQPKLPTLKLRLGTNEIVGEIARADHERQMGMMFRTSMAENEGMLFVFEAPHQASFWMKNTTVPLTAAYIDSAGVILELRDLKPKDETPAAAATERVRYVLEVPQGWFQRHGVTPGMSVATERGSLGRVFFGEK